MIDNNSGLAFSAEPTPTTPTDQGINLNPQVKTLPDNIQQDRASRADFAMGDQSPGQKALADEFRSGNEASVRQQVAAQTDADFKKQKLDTIQSIVNSNTPVSATDLTTLTNIGTTPGANPDTVFEDKYGSRMMTGGIAGEPGKNLVFQSAFDDHPDKVNDGAQLGAAAISIHRQVQNVLEETQAAHDALPWVAIPALGIGKADQEDKLGDLAKSFLTMGISQYVNQRNLLNSDAVPGSIMPGKNKLEQIQWLYLNSNPGEILRAAVGPDSQFFKDHPKDALDFAKAAYQYSSSDSYVDNIMGVANVASLPGMGFIGKGLLKLGVAGLGRAVPFAEEKTLAQLSQEAKNAQTTAHGVLLNSPGAPKTAAQSPYDLSNDILSKPPSIPTNYYVPKEAVEDIRGRPTNLEALGVGPDGKPIVQTSGGAYADVRTVPQEGDYRLHVAPPTNETTVTTRNGATTPYTPGSGQLGGKNTFYVDKAGADTLSKVLMENKNYQLLQDDKGRWFVGDRDNGGAKVSKYVTPQNEPARDLIPVHPGEGNDKDTFGHRVTRVDNGTDQRVTLGTKVVSPQEQQTKVALADIVRAQQEDNAQNMLGRMGQHDTAAEVAANERLTEESQDRLPIKEANRIARAVPTNAQPIPYYNDASSLSWRRAMELIDKFKEGLNATRIEDLPPTAWQKAWELAKQEINRYNRVSSDAIRDRVTHWNPLTNTYSVETRIGQPNGTLFQSADQANFWKNMQYRLGSTAEVRQEGKEFYLAHLKDFDITQSAVRDAIPIGNETPKGWLQSWFSMATGGRTVGQNIRSSAYTVSGFQRANRITATHAPSYLNAALENEARNLATVGGELTKAERQELGDMLVHNRDAAGPGSNRRGFFYQGRQDFDTAFYSKFGYNPSDKQWNAYESYKNLSDLDWMLRESEDYRAKSINGVRKFQMKFTNRDGNKVTTDWVDGKLQPNFNPNVTPDANVYVIPDNKFVSKYDLKDGSAYSKTVMDKIKSGEYKIIQMYDPRDKPMQATTGIKDDIHFIVTDKFDERAVRWGENVEYRPGGHVIYVGQHYVSQPQIGIGTSGKPTFFGDVNVKAFESKKDAEFWAKRYDQAREFYKNGDRAGFDNHVSANLPETPDQIWSKFQDGTFNADHPFVHRDSGRDSLQSNVGLLDSPLYRDLRDRHSAYNLRQTASTAFLQERNEQLSTVANTGTAANPIWQNVDAPLLDPYSSLGQGLSQIVRQRWMGEYKQAAAESWVAEFGKLFDQSKLPIDRLRLNPLYYLYHTDGMDQGLLKANPELYAAAMTSRANILRFIGARDEVGNTVDGLTQQLINGIDNKLGRNAAKRAETALPFIKNIPQYMRQMTFNLVDGLFNVIQFPQQALGFTNALAISPKNAVYAMTAKYLARGMAQTEDPAILGHFADQAAKMGWNRDQFLEAVQAWKESGVHHIGGEVTARSTLDDPQLFQSLTGKFLDKGRWFFNKGEEINRDISYFTAYRDWRDANPDRVLDNRAKTEVLSRFDTLNMNMTRASNAAYNEGILSIPTQFWTWNARHFEQMATFGAGRQLTVAEKARVIGLNSLLWGVPSALGGATFGGLGLLPTNFDDIRQFAINHGINLHDGFIEAISKGLPEYVMNILHGPSEGDKTQGLSQGIDLHRFSPNADQTKILADIQSGKKNLYDLMFGASGSMVMKMGAATYPFLTWASNAFTENNPYPLKGNDFLNVMENWSAFNNAEKGWVAYNTGKYYSKNEQLQADEVSGYEALMLGMGLGLNRVSDAWQMKSVEQGKKSAQEKIEKHILEDANIMFNAAQRGDQQTAEDYRKRINAQIIAGGWTLAEQQKIWNSAKYGRESLIDNVNQQWLRQLPSTSEVNKFFQNLKAQ